MAFLEGPSEKQAEIIRQDLRETPGDVEDGVQDLLSMCAASPHLPPPERLDPKFLEHFVRGCRMRRDRTRVKFEAFWMSRARHMDLYEYQSFNKPPLSAATKFIDVIPLPKLTFEGYRVTILRVRPNYPDSSADVVNLLRAILLVSDARMKDETLIAGDVFIWEVTHVRGSLAPKMLAAANTVRRGIYLAQAAYPQRIKRIHVVGASSFLHASLQLMRSCVNEKIRNRYYLHPKVEDLLEYIPARVMPIEWGGEEESLEVLSKKWKRRIDEVQDHLHNLNELATQDTRMTAHSDIYGTVGAFRKLDID